MAQACPLVTILVDGVPLMILCRELRQESMDPNDMGRRAHRKDSHEEGSLSF